MKSKINEKAYEIVMNEIESNISYLISELAQNEKYFDDLAPILSRDTWECSKCGESFNLESDADVHVLEKHERVEHSSDVLDLGTNEALEHWIVSTWLFNRLENQGEMVTEFMGLKIWGRCTSGQAIAYDGVIQQIAANSL